MGSTLESAKDIGGLQWLAHSGIQRLANQSSLCKLWSILLSVLTMLLIAVRDNGDALMWTLLPVGLLAMLDGCYAGRIASLVSIAEKQNGAPLDALRAEAALLGIRNSMGAAQGILSLSIWPFYLGLAGIMVGLGLTVFKGSHSEAHQPQDNPAPSLAAIKEIHPNQFGGAYRGASPTGGLPGAAGINKPAGIQPGFAAQVSSGRAFGGPSGAQFKTGAPIAKQPPQSPLNRPVNLVPNPSTVPTIHPQQPQAPIAPPQAGQIGATKGGPPAPTSNPAGGQ